MQTYMSNPKNKDIFRDSAETIDILYVSVRSEIQVQYKCSFNHVHGACLFGYHGDGTAVLANEM